MMKDDKKLANTNKSTAQKKNQKTAHITKKINRKVHPPFPKKQSPKTCSHLPSKTQHINKFYFKNKRQKTHQLP
jgi:hypothetical protein